MPTINRNNALLKSQYKSDFDKAVKTLTDDLTSLMSTTTFQELSQAERKCRDDLFALQHFSLGLGYWVKQTVDYQRQVINANPVASSDYLHQLPSSQVSTEKKSRVTKRKKK